jgi:hypothetical protein
MTIARATTSHHRCTKLANKFGAVPLKSIQNFVKSRNFGIQRKHDSCCSTTTTAAPVCSSSITTYHGNRRRVQFAERNNKVLLIQKVPEDVRESWYGPQEYYGFDLERKRTVGIVQNACGDIRSLEAYSGLTVKGLEHQLSYQQAMARKHSTKRHVYCVLKQQHENKWRGVSDDESLRQVSELFSKQPSKRAHLRGVLDYTMNTNSTGEGL